MNSCLLESQSLTKPCSLPDSMTAQDACEQKKLKEDNIHSVMTNIFGGFTPQNIIKALGSNAESASQTLTTMGLNIDSKSLISQVSQCDTWISQVQSNIIKGPSIECIQTMIAAGFTQAEIKSMNTIQNISMENKAGAITTCKINKMLESLSKMDASIDNAALTSALNNAKGLLSSSKSDDFTCTNINTTMNACKYIQQTDCCSNKINQEQLNLIDAGCGASILNVKMKHEANALVNCELTSVSKVSDELVSKLKSKTEQTSKNTSEGLSMGFLVIIVVIILCVIVLPKLFTMYKSNKTAINKTAINNASFNFVSTNTKLNDDNIFYISGGILITMFIILLILYFFTGSKEEKRIDSPFINCNKSELVYGKGPSKERMTYDAAVSKAKNDSSIMAFDFFSDKPEEINILDGDTGLVVFFGYVDIKETCSNISDTTKSHTSSYVKSKSKIVYIYLSILCLIIGLGLIIFQFYKTKMNKKQNKYLI